MWSILTSGSLTLKVSKDMLCDVLLYFVGWSDCSLLFAAHLLSDCDYLTCSSTTGAELSVLQGMDFSLVSISAIVMESDQSDEAKDAQKVAILTSNGYSCTRVLRNHFCKLHTLLPSAAPERERVYTGARNRYIRSTPTPWEGWSLHVSTWVSQSRPVEATRHTHLAGRGRGQGTGDRQAGGQLACCRCGRNDPLPPPVHCLLLHCHTSTSSQSHTPLLSVMTPLFCFYEVHAGTLAAAGYCDAKRQSKSLW